MVSQSNEEKSYRIPSAGGLCTSRHSKKFRDLEKIYMRSSKKMSLCLTINLELELAEISVISGSSVNVLLPDGYGDQLLHLHLSNMATRKKTRKHNGQKKIVRMVITLIYQI